MSLQIPFKKHDRLIHVIIRKKEPRLGVCCLTRHDLVRIGREAAMKAEASHDPEGLPLGTWVGIVIDQRLDEAISLASPVSRWSWLMIEAVRAATSRFQLENGGGKPSVEDLQHMTGLSERQIDGVSRMEQALDVRPIEDVVDEVESIIDEGVDVERSAITAALVEQVWSHIDLLARQNKITEAEVEVARLHFESGMDTVRIAAKTGLSRPAVSLVIRRVIEIVQLSGLVDDPKVVAETKLLRSLTRACRFRGIARTKRAALREAIVEPVARSHRPIIERRTRISTRAISESEVDPRNRFDPEGRLYGYFQAFLDGGGRATYGEIMGSCLRLSAEFGIVDSSKAIQRDLNNQTWNWLQGRWGLLVTRDDSMCEKTCSGCPIKADRDRVEFTCVEVQGKPFAEVMQP